MAKMEAAATWEPIDSLTPWDRNPRRNDGAVESVAHSITRFGFGAPIIARTSDRVIIGGHTRYKAAQRLGLDKVPVRFLDLDPAEAAALALADNKLGELAEWDDAGVAAILAELEAQGAPIDGLGWDDEELKALLGDGLETAPPSDDAPELDEQGEPDSQPGAVYQLGPHRLVCGDCRDAATVSRLMDGRRINLAFTSPPYASQRTYDESSGFKPIHPNEYCAWFDAVQSCVKENLSSDGSWFVNIKEHCDDGQRHLYVKDLTIAHVRTWGWRFIDELIWLRVGVPGHPLKMGGRFKNGFEPVFHYAAGKHKMRPDAVTHATSHTVRYDEHDHTSSSVTKSGGAVKLPNAGAGLAYPNNVLDIKGIPDKEGHPAAFTPDLPLFFINAYTDVGDTVYDPFMGSGTTLVAAAAAGRIGYGCEISPRYCDIIRKRWTRYADENGLDAGPGALRQEVRDVE